MYQEHASALSRYAASFARTPDAARDAVQEIFLRYFVERRYGRQIENPRAWLYFVLRNHLQQQMPAPPDLEASEEDRALAGSKETPPRR